MCDIAAKAILAASLSISALNVGTFDSLVIRVNSVGTPALSSSGNAFACVWSHSMPLLANGWDLFSTL